MGTVKYRLKGHESFCLREGWINKGLKAVHDDPKVFSKNSGADALGVGTNMAKSIRYWLKAAMLTKENSTYGASLTPLGDMIFTYDPYIEDEFSLWLMHINIVRNFELATSWYLFFNDLEVTSFSKDNLFEMQKAALEQHIGETKISSRSLSDDCTAILSMYTENREEHDDPEDKRNSPFASLGLLHQNGNIYQKCLPSMARLNSLLLLYIIQDELLEMKSILIDDIVERANMPGKVLNLNRVVVNEYLDVLQDNGYLIVNRTAGLDVVYPNCIDTAEEIVRKYYERGIR